MVIKLELIGGRSKDRVLIFEPGKKMVFGRGPQCDVQILDKELSRIHCEVANVGDQLVLTDMGSSNGCFCNGTRQSRFAITVEDDVQIGSVKLRIPRDTQSLEPAEKKLHSTIAFVTSELESDTGQRIRKRYDQTGVIQPMAAPADIPQEYKRANEVLQSIYKLTNQINAVTDLDSLLEYIIETTIDICNAERGALLIRNRQTGEIEPAIIRKSKAVKGDVELSVSRTIVDEVVSQGLSVLTSDAGSDQRFKAGVSIIMQKIKSAMCVPLRTENEIIGAVYVDSTSLLGSFVEQDLDLLSAIGHQAGMAIQRARLMEDLSGMFVGAIKMISTSIEARDKYTFGHAERVTAFSLSIAESLDLPRKQQEGVWLAGLLHDVGKIGVPDRVLNKPGPLDDAEYAEIKKHPHIGDEIISNIPNIREMVEGGIRHHHERWDGKGYPDGLSGEDIPLFARIMAVADSYDAMTSDRPYRRGFEPEKALKIIQENAGTQFDPKLAEVFVSCYHSGRLADTASVFLKYYGIRREAAKEAKHQESPSGAISQAPASSDPPTPLPEGADK